MNNLSKILIFIALISLSLWSCKKESVDLASSEDVRAADLAVSDVFTFTSSETNSKKSDTTSNQDGMMVVREFNITSASWTTTITFDNYTPTDGVTRNGQIQIVWKLGWFWDSTKTVTVTFNEFSRDSVVLSGELHINHYLSATDTIGTPKNRIDEINMKLTFPDGANITWEGWRTIEWKSGWLTNNIFKDNKFEINWHKEGLNRRGDAFSGDGAGLIQDMSCNKRGFTAGIITILKGNGDTFTVDFGNGACDGTYTVTSGNNIIEVTP